MAKRKTITSAEKTDIIVATPSLLPDLVRGTKIIFYRFGCGCGKEDIRVRIRNKIMSLGADTMKEYHERRVEYDPDWLKEAQALGFNNCGFSITWPNGEHRVVTLPEFIGRYL